MMIRQIPLGMWLREGVTFENFAGDANRQLLTALHDPHEHFVFLWGAHGLGKSHLLQAACHAATAHGERSVYLPLAEAGQFAPAILDGLEQMALVAIDDLDTVTGEREWETALFHLYNRIRDGGGCRLLVAARRPLTLLGLVLPDLRSRLGWGLVYQMQPLSDKDKLLALQQRARRRGFDLSDEVGDYLMRHYPRDTGRLFRLLDDLDQRSLAEQRRLTIPFVKQVIESEQE
jgi:DnaA family protein